MKDMIREVKDFPKTGVVFRDIFPLLYNHFPEVIDDLSKKIEIPASIEYFAGVESRGFIFAAALAYKLHKGFIPIRKAGKLPPPFIKQDAKTEYSQISLEMPKCPSKEPGRIFLVDDLVATGGTILASWKLSKSSGYYPIGALALINLPKLNHPELHKLIGFKFKSLFDYEE